jgi:hypothetical protein
MLTFQKLLINCIFIQQFFLWVFSQSPTYQWPTLNTSVKYDLTGSVAIQTLLNKSNLLSDKYEKLQVKGNYLTRTTNAGELEIFNLTDLTLLYNEFKSLTTQMVAFDIP